MPVPTFDHVCRFFQFSGRCKRSYVPCGCGDIFSSTDDVGLVSSIFLGTPQKTMARILLHYMYIYLLDNSKSYALMAWTIIMFRRQLKQMNVSPTLGLHR